VPSKYGGTIFAAITQAHDVARHVRCLMMLLAS